MKIRILTFLLLVILSVSGANFLLSKLVIATDKSVKPFLFWKEKGKKIIDRGDYVLVKGKGLGEGKLFTKKVLCKAGDRVKKVGLSYYCCVEGNKCIYLHSAYLETPKGKKLTIWNPCGGDAKTSKCEVEIKEGEYYLGNSVPLGYDSRYLGLFKQEEILAVLKPII